MLEDYLSIDDILSKYPQFKKGQLRWLIVQKDKNGLAPHLKRIGRKIYFYIPGFLEWIDKQEA